MSRGGRGGGRGGRGGMRGNPLPFDVDADLVDSAQGSVTDVSDENKAKQLFPLIEQIIPAPLATEERRLCAAHGEMTTKYRKSHIWTGTRKQIDTLNGSKDRAKAVFDAFDAGDTYSKRKRARQVEDFVPPEKRKLPKMNEEMTPQTLVRDAKDAASTTKKKSSSTNATKKSVTDKLANLDESKDDEGNKSDDESVDGAAKAGDDANEDAASEPQDSEFEEDEADDADNDYNAENYFSGGEGDDGDDGGDDGDEGESDSAFRQAVAAVNIGATNVVVGMGTRLADLFPGTKAWERAKRRWQ